VVQGGNNIFIESQTLDIKTYQKKVTAFRQVFILKVMKNLTKYETLWKELSLETPDSNKVKSYLADYYNQFLDMRKFMKLNQFLLKIDP